MHYLPVTLQLLAMARLCVQEAQLLRRLLQLFAAQRLRLLQVPASCLRHGALQPPQGGGVEAVAGTVRVVGGSCERHSKVQAAVAVPHEHEGKGAASARKPRVLAAAKHGAQGVAAAVRAEPELAGVASADDPAARVRHFRKAVLALVRRVLSATGRQGQSGLCC